MWAKLKSFFSPKSYCETIDDNADTAFKQHIELEKDRLEASLQLLKKTTDEVSIAAVNAAIVLEQRLRDTEHRFYSTIDTIDDLVIIKDGDGRWKTVNKIGQELFGWYHGEHYNKTDRELIALFPQMKDTLSKCILTDDAAWDLGRSNRGEEYITFGNSYRILDVIKTPVFNADGTRKELIIIGRDMTEIIEKQRRNKACFHAMNSVSDGIVIIDSKARIVFSNDEFNRRFGINDYEKILNKKMIDVLPWLTKYDDIWQHARNNDSIKIATEEAGDILVMPMMNGLPKPIYFICTFKKS
jgi:PAS domain S-box-containing protein